MKSEGQRESRKQEDRLAKKFGGQRVAASGAFWSRKGDVRSADMLWEAKWTSKQSFSIKRGILKKVSVEAVMAGRMPALHISFSGEDNYVVLTEFDFMELYESSRNPSV